MLRPIPSKQPRHGVTLTEVLVAIFVMGIGLLSLLTLFPLGALHMAQAIHDDRCTNATLNARAFANMQIPYLGDPGAGNPVFSLCEDPFTVSPYYTPSQLGGFSNLLPVPLDGPSTPVYIDPVGCWITKGYTPAQTAPYPPTGITLPAFCASNNIPPCYPLGPLPGASNGIPRVCPSIIPLYDDPKVVNPFNYIERYCYLTDDIEFMENGDINPLATGGAVARDLRYSWAWLCRQVRPQGPTSPPSPNAYGINVTIVVYDRRPLTTGANGAPAGETPYNAVFTYGSNFATLTWPAAAPPPPIRKGTWILDATVMNTPNGKPNGYFYRVVEANIGAGSAVVELHMNARANSGPQGVAVVMENVAEVYEKP
jgi:prepilin-type N-terminal cleavage/methylation domain-containing protein